MTNSNDAPGMKGQRSRNEDGKLRKKRGDTKIGTIEKQYDIDFEVRSDKLLSTQLKDKNVKSLNELIKSTKKKK